MESFVRLLTFTVLTSKDRHAGIEWGWPCDGIPRGKPACRYKWGNWNVFLQTNFKVKTKIKYGPKGADISQNLNLELGYCDYFWYVALDGKPHHAEFFWKKLLGFRDKYKNVKIFNIISTRIKNSLKIRLTPAPQIDINKTQNK